MKSELELLMRLSAKLDKLGVSLDDLTELVRAQSVIWRRLSKIETLLAKLSSPNETRLASEIVAQHEPEHRPSSHGASLSARQVANPRATNAALRELYDTPCRQSVIPSAKQHPTLGSL